MPRSLSHRREFFRSTFAAAAAAAGASLPWWFSARRAGAEPGKAKIKVFMHWDMEGTSGLFTRQQAWYKEKGVKPEVGSGQPGTRMNLVFNGQFFRISGVLKNALLSLRSALTGEKIPFPEEGCKFPAFLRERTSLGPHDR